MPWGRCVRGHSGRALSAQGLALPSSAWGGRARTPRPSRSGRGGVAGGAPLGRAGSNETWPRGQLTRVAGVGPVRPVWAQALPMRHRMRGGGGNRARAGIRGPMAQAHRARPNVQVRAHRAGPGPPRARPSAQAPRAPPAAPQRPPRRRGGGRRVRKPGLEGSGRLVRTVVPRSLRARRFCQRPGSGSAGLFPPEPGLGCPGAALPGPGGAGPQLRGGASGTGRGLELGQEGPEQSGCPG